MITGLHTKACLRGLGVEEGLRTIVQAGFRRVVVWAGEEGECLEAFDLARQAGLRVMALALPKLTGLTGSRMKLREWIARAAALEAPAVSLILDDRRETEASTDDWCELGRCIEEAGIPIVVENNGRSSERFADPRELGHLVELAPSARIALDLGHLASSGHAELDLRDLRSRLAWVEVHDNDGVRDMHLPLGQGTGVGCSTRALTQLGVRPRYLVVESDPGCGTDRLGWVRALRAERALAEAALANLASGVAA